MEVEGFQVDRAIRDDGVEHFACRYATRDIAMYPVGAKHPRSSGVGLGPGEYTPLYLGETSGTLQLRFQHRTAGRRHVHVTVDKSGHHQPTGNIHALDVEIGTSVDDLLAAD